MASYLTMTSLLALAAGFSASPALGQERDVSVPVAPKPVVGNDGDASQSEESLADIVVTAQRRSERLERVPIAITAVSPEAILDLNIRDVEGIKKVAPSVTFDSGLAFAQVFIRGIGTPYPTAGLEPSVSTYVDGAYLARAYATQFDLLDVQTVQVLNGPQGTLYGRNATGGVILINSADPVFETTGRVLAEYGNYDHKLGEAVLNVPATDTLAFRFAGRYSEDDGFLNNFISGQKYGAQESYAVRGKMLFEPNKLFKAVLTLEQSFKKSDLIQRAVGPVQSCLACQITGVTPLSGTNDIRADPLPPVRSLNRNANLKLEKVFGSITVQNIASYRDTNSRSPVDQDGEGIPLFVYNSRLGGKTTTEDLVVSSNFGGIVDFLGGVSYVHDASYINAFLEGLAFSPLLAAFGTYPETRVNATLNSVAAYVETTVRPSENFSVIVGGRYTSDKRRLDVSINAAAQAGFTAGGAGPRSFNSEAKFNAFTPRIVATYQINGINLYASYNEGFKAGGFNSPAFVVAPAVNPEKIKSYEVGLKYVGLGGRLRGSIAVFTYRHRDVQVSITDLLSGGQVIRNAAATKAKGVEADLRYSVSQAFQVTTGLSYFDGNYVSYPNASIIVPTPSGGLAQGTGDLSGIRLPRTPEWSVFTGVNGSVDVFSGWSFGYAANARYSSSYDFLPAGGGPLRRDRQDALLLVDASVNVGPQDGNFKIGLYVSNLTNRFYQNSVQTAAPFATLEQPARPRTFGVRLGYDF